MSVRKIASISTSIWRRFRAHRDFDTNHHHVDARSPAFRKSRASRTFVRVPKSRSKNPHPDSTVFDPEAQTRRERADAKKDKADKKSNDKKSSDTGSEAKKSDDDKSKDPAPSVTHGSIKIDGQKIRYTATAGKMTMKISGTFSDDAFAIDNDMETTMPGGARTMKIKAKTTGKRVGDCPGTKA